VALQLALQRALHPPSSAQLLPARLRGRTGHRHPGRLDGLARARPAR